jgi:hypothetical protein
VLVPNRARLSPDMQAETGYKYASFIPLGGAPLYKRIISQYRCDGHRVRMVFLLAPDAPELEIDPSETMRVEVVRPDESASIGQTVLAGLKKIAPTDAVVVHMADTLLDIDGVPLGDAVYVQSRSDLYRWTSISVDPTGCVKITNDREAIEPCGPRLVCVGLFSFDDGERLAAELARAVAQSSPKREPFFVSAMDGLRARGWLLRVPDELSEPATLQRLELRPGTRTGD